MSDAHEYTLQSTVEEEEEKEEKETKEETFEDDEGVTIIEAKRTKISSRSFGSRKKKREENSVVAKIVHERFKEYATVHDPYLRDDGLFTLFTIDLENEEAVNGVRVRSSGWFWDVS